MGNTCVNLTKHIPLSLKNPILRHHVVYGQPILPGLAYIDLIYQVFQEHSYSYSELELVNLSMHHPLSAEENRDTLLTIQCLEKESGVWNVSVESEKLHIKAQMKSKRENLFGEPLDLESFKHSAEKVTDIDDAYAQCSRQELVHSGFMKLNGKIYHKTEGILMEISLSPEALPTASHFIFHPALIDGSGVGSNTMLYSLLEGETRLFVPLFYESFSANEQLQSACFTRIQSSSLRYERELIYMTLEFFNAKGIKVGELKNFVSKLVRKADLINPERKEVVLKDKEAASLPFHSFKNGSLKMPNHFSDLQKNNPNAQQNEGFQSFLSHLIARRLNLKESEVSVDSGYYEMGLDSPAMLAMVDAIGEKIGAHLSPTLLFEYPTISQLAVYLSETWGSAASVKTKVDVSSFQDALPTTDIAIIGMSGRFPQAKDLSEFWNNLKCGRDCITEVPPSRWRWQDFEEIVSPSGKKISKWGGFIDDPHGFDTQFFQISPREAETMDPQERLFLEVCWEAIEDAGYTPKTLAGNSSAVGVFVGVMHKDYTLIGSEAVSKENPFPLALNNAPIANRVSYYCNFQGPSFSVDTLCSSSLTAIHLAIESLRRGECESALAGGVNLSLHPQKYITYGSEEMFSTDGRCRSFGKGGNGYVPAEGIASILLKPLHQAIEDGDQIYGVVKASAINHVGKVSGMTVPSPTAQAALIEDCLKKAKIDARTISYVEAHGTGTSLGDPIEVQGLTRAFRQHTDECQFCALGSVKSNIGHAESAAGVIGVIKAALQLHHQTLVPSLHAEELNPYLQLHESPFFIQQKVTPWPASQTPRRACINSFGATGSNAHLIIEEYIAPKTVQEDSGMVLIPLSAKSKDRLLAYAEKLFLFLKPDIDIELTSLAYTLQVGRLGLDERVVFIVNTLQELRKQLHEFLNLHGETLPNNNSNDHLLQVAKQWKNGSFVDWNKLYLGKKPRRISLPTYPFLSEKYWVPQKAGHTPGFATIHPLLHQNTSNLEELRFSSTFTGSEFFFADHLVRKKKILPGVAYLEMVRAGLEKILREKRAITFKDIVWVQPMIVDRGSQTVHLTFLPEQNNEEIAFEVYGEEVFSQGRAVISDRKDLPAEIDLDEIKKTCLQEISPASCYAAYRAKGIDYGESFQCIRKLYLGENQILVKLELSPSDKNGFSEYTLHPALLDAALHASIAFELNGALRLPFSLKKASIWKECTSSMWGHLIKRGESLLDLILFDEMGGLIVEIEGLSSRLLHEKEKMHFFEPIWEQSFLEDSLVFNHCEEFSCSAGEEKKLFLKIQALFKSKLESPFLLQVKLEGEEIDAPTLNALSALLKTAHLENPFFYGELIFKGKRQSLTWKELVPEMKGKETVWRDGGVYLITGGQGGLGLIFAKEILKKAKNPTVILTGRSPLDPQKINSSSSLIYKQVDITQKEALFHLIGEIKENYDSLHGIIHSAGLIQDSFIIQKSVEEFEQVLKPKVAGTIYLDEATADMDLDFFVLFSSGTGGVGNPAQADYATANGFMNGYAEYRASRRPGKTISILWPLWREGGMQVNAETEASMQKQTGMVAMETPAGIAAFYQALEWNRPQILVVAGDSAKIRAYLNPQIKKTDINSKKSLNIKGIEQERAERYFIKQLASLLKLSDERMDPTAPLEKYGIDSVMVIRMTNQLEAVFGPLSKTLFFEYQTIRELTGYFIQSHYSTLSAQIGEEKPALKAAEEMPSTQKLRSFRSAFSQPKEEEIAIIGIAGRYPQAKSLTELWKNLAGGKDCITEIPQARWNHTLYFDADKSKTGKTYSKWGGFIEDADLFDPLFFQIPPNEAHLMDPQERLFLQCVYETLDNAGYGKGIGLGNQVSVYVGVMFEEYQLYGAQEQERGNALALSGSLSSIANRVSYFFNFQGISLALDTMCSSSLTALHLACESLKNGECEAAIAGGVNLSVHPNKYLLLAQRQFVSSKGRCESFGIGGDGYVPGEGVGAVLLKPLSKAITDHDHIYGIVKGSALNHGGKTNGYFVPNPNAQADVIKKALRAAKVSPREISYIEAHGTGTSLGDPIEITGLAKAFSEQIDAKQFCAIGSVKSNIGHCESAAGIASLTKVLLQLKHKKIVPSLHSRELNPHIDFDQSPFVVQQELTDWKSGSTPRIAGISSFGAGGSNAHVIISEFHPAPSKYGSHTPPFLIILSARREDQLKLQAERLLNCLDEEGYNDDNLMHIAYTLQVGREAMEERLAFLTSTVDELKGQLSHVIAGKKEEFRGSVFSGQHVFQLFEDDEDMKKTVDSWMQKRKYSKILQGWVNGLEIEWAKLYTGEKPRRIPLPSYPFAQKSYWLSRKENHQSTDLFNLCFFNKQWERSPAEYEHKRDRRVLILTTAESQNLANEIVKLCPNSQCINVNKVSPATFTINEEFTGCIDLVGYTELEEPAMHVNWIQQLIAKSGKNNLKAICVTSGLEPHLNSSKSFSSGSRAALFRLLRSEYQNFQSRHVDLDPLDEGFIHAKQIVQEFYTASEDLEICFRKGERYRAVIKKMPKEKSDRLSEKSFPQEKSLLITGGMRGLGYLCARHFVQHYGVKKLILTGREPLPPRKSWHAYNGLDTPSGQKIAAIQELETMGVEVNVVAELAEIEKRAPEIGGVIHCAGITGGKNPAFIRKTAEEFERVLEPKVSALKELYHILKDQPIEFFVLFSSVSSIIPSLGAGQSDYAMANAFMDYFAEFHKANFPLISIQWPSWKESGVGEVKSKAYAATGLLSLTNQMGLGLLDQILESKERGVILPAAIIEEKCDYQSWLKAGTQILSHNWLKEQIAIRLKMDPCEIEIDKPFHDYGIDSIFLAQLVQDINEKTQSTIDPSIFYEYSNIRSLTDYLASTSLPFRLIEDGSENIAISTIPSLPTTSRLLDPEQNQQGIAIVGMSCRFAGADRLEAFWELISKGQRAIQKVPLERWGYATPYFAGLLENPLDFDASFFQMDKTEASKMDPQALLILEECRKLLLQKDADLQRIKKRAIGVYIGGRSLINLDQDQLLTMRNPILAIGQNYLAANVSQFFDLRGPSMVLDTACSSALVSMNIAIQALNNHEIEAAIVGGVSYLGTDTVHKIFERRGLLNPESIFHVFDQRANGVVLGEGVGVVLIKRVNQAIKDGDPILAVIKGIALNNDGKTLSPTTPDIESQKAVMQQALQNSNKKPEEIEHIEANASGSTITDLLELKAIQSVYRSTSRLPLSIGSIKPNIGHPLCAEGIASFIKVVLMLHNRCFVPFLSGREKMNHFDHEAAHFHFNHEREVWKTTRPVAALNCFADGGTNVHLVIEGWETNASTPIYKNNRPKFWKTVGIHV